MAEYDTMLEFGETGDICQEIADEYGQRLHYLLDLTEETGEEYAIMVWKHNGVLHATDEVEGETGFFKKSIKSEDVSAQKMEVAREVGIEDANEFYREVEWLIGIHTHPGGDPSPSSGDLLVMLDNAKKARKVELDNTHFISSEPIMNGLLAVSQQHGEVIITGMLIPDEMPGHTELNAYEDEVKSFQVGNMPKFFDSDEEKEDFLDKRRENYRELLGKITGDYNQYASPVLRRCHAKAGYR